MRIQHKTTRRRYEKYRDMAKAAGISLLNIRDFLGYSHAPCNYALGDQRDPRGIRVTCNACWHCMYRLDTALNIVPLREWDMQVIAFQVYHANRVIKSLGDSVCLYKHLAIYEILRAEPVFEGES